MAIVSVPFATGDPSPAGGYQTLTREAMAGHKANGATYGNPVQIDVDTRQRIRATRA